MSDFIDWSQIQKEIWKKSQILFFFSLICLSIVFFEERKNQLNIVKSSLSLWENFFIKRDKKSDSFSLIFQNLLSSELCDIDIKFASFTLKFLFKKVLFLLIFPLVLLLTKKSTSVKKIKGKRGEGQLF